MIKLNLEAQDGDELFGVTQEQIFATADRLDLWDAPTPENVQKVLDDQCIPINEKLWFVFTFGCEEARKAQRLEQELGAAIDRLVATAAKV